METKKWWEICNNTIYKIRGEGKGGQQMAASKYIQYQTEAHNHDRTSIDRSEKSWWYYMTITAPTLRWKINPKNLKTCNHKNEERKIKLHIVRDIGDIETESVQNNQRLNKWLTLKELKDELRARGLPVHWKKSSCWKSCV